MFVVVQLLATLRAEFPESNAPTLLEAAQCAKARQPVQAAQLLQAATTTSSDLVLVLTRAQLQLRAKETEAAVETLSALVAKHHEPALLGTLVALHEGLGNIDAAVATLKTADNETFMESASFFEQHGKWRGHALAVGIPKTYQKNCTRQHHWHFNEGCWQ